MQTDYKECLLTCQQTMFFVQFRVKQTEEWLISCAVRGIK